MSRRGARLWARLKGHVSRRHEWYWAPLVYGAAVVFLYRHIFWPGGQGFGWDTIESYWGDLAYLAGAWGDGEAPLWNPFEVGGSPAAARPSRSTYYLFNWPFVVYGAAAGEVSWWLIQIKMLSHHVVAGLMMHLYLRSRGLGRSAACVGGVAWMASAPMLIHKASAILWPIVWTPLLWLATDKLAQKPTWRTGAGLAAAAVLAGTAGSPPGFFYTLLMAVPYGLWRVGQSLWDGYARGQSWSRARALAGAVAVAAVVTVAMLLITVLPTRELTELSQRAKRSVGYALQFPLPLKPALTGMWAPSTGTADAYIGVLVMMLAGCALIIKPLRDRGAALVHFVSAAFFMMLAFGAATPVLAWLVTHVPGFDLFRAANRYKILAMPMLAAVAAYGVASLQAVARSRARIAALATAAAGVALVAWLLTRFPNAANMAKHLEPSRSLWLVAVAFVLVAAAVLMPRRLRAWPVLLMVPVIAYDPQYFVHIRGPSLEKRPDNQEDRRFFESLPGAGTDYRVYDEFVMEQRAGSRLGIREFRGYPAGSSLEYRRYGAVIRQVKTHPEILAAYNVRYIFHGRHHRASMGANHIRRPPDQIAPAHVARLAGAGPKVFELKHPAPLAAWYGAVKEARGERAVLRQVLQSDDGSGAGRYGVLEPDAMAALGSSGERLRAAAADPPEPVAAEITSYRRNQVRLRVSAPAPGVVVLNEVHYPGWRVEVDGHPAQPFFVNWLVRGVAVDAGEHEISWTFRPTYYSYLLLLWTLGVYFFLAALFAPKRAVLRRMWARLRARAESRSGYY